MNAVLIDANMEFERSTELSNRTLRKPVFLFALRRLKSSGASLFVCCAFILGSLV
jgi:hypothetical protein